MEAVCTKLLHKVLQAALRKFPRGPLKFTLPTSKEPIFGGYFVRKKAESGFKEYKFETQIPAAREIWVGDRPFPFFRLYFLLALWLPDSVTAELHK